MYQKREKHFLQKMSPHLIVTVKVDTRRNPRYLQIMDKLYMDGKIFP